MGFDLPPEIRELIAARNQLRKRYLAFGLQFTLDGKLVGDIGEAIASEMFGIQLAEGNATGIDGYAPDGRTVQVKATGTGRGPVFRHVDRCADHLLFFSLDFETLTGEVVFNGPEEIALRLMPESWNGQRPVPMRTIRHADQLVRDDQRLAHKPQAGGPID